MDKFLKYLAQPLFAFLACVVSIVAALVLATQVASLGPVVSTIAKLLAIVISVCNVLVILKMLDCKGMGRLSMTFLQVTNATIIIGATLVLVENGAGPVLSGIAASIALCSIYCFVKYIKLIKSLSESNVDTTYKLTEYEQQNTVNQDVISKLRADIHSLTKLLDAERDAHSGCKHNLRSVQAKREQEHTEYVAAIDKANMLTKQYAELQSKLNIVTEQNRSLQQKCDDVIEQYNEAMNCLQDYTNRCNDAEERLKALQAFKTAVEAKRIKANERRREKRKQNKQ